MDLHVNQLAEYYGQAPVIFGDVFKQTLQPGILGVERRTAEGYGGLVFPIEGRARFTFNGCPYEIEPGTIAHGGPDMELCKEALSERSCSFVVVHYWLPAEEVARYPLHHEHFCVRMDYYARTLELAQQLLQEYNTPGRMAALKTKLTFFNLIYEMVISINRQFRDENSKMMAQAADYIREHYAEPLTVEKLALQFGYDRRRFTYLFERETGMSPMNYLTRVRIGRSREMLKNYSCSVAQVAEWVGYSDSFYFSRIFKKHTGISPTEFRKQG